MSMTAGCDHIALVTRDLDRFIDFYTAVFDADVTLDLFEEGARHAMIDLGGGFRLHPFELVAPNEYGTGSDEFFNRGHLDHLAIRVSDTDSFEELRRRLVDAGASDGEIVDWGSVRTIWFTDPDGMGSEIAISADGATRTRDDVVREPYLASPTG